MITVEELQIIKARAEKATPGPWEDRARISGGCEIVGFIHQGWSTPVARLYDGFMWYEGDREFIAHARDDVPALIAEVERLQAEVDRARRRIIPYRY